MELSLTPRDVVDVLRRRWRVAATVFGATLALSLVVTLLQTSLYEATSVLLVKFGREFVYRPEVGERDAIFSRDRQAFINAELQILRSYDLISSVVSSVGVENLYPDLAKDQPSSPTLLQSATQKFYGNFDAATLPDSDVLRLTFRHPNAKMTVDALRLLVDRFREKHLQAFGDAQTVTFLAEKVSEYRKGLDKAEDDIKRFQGENRQYLDQGEPLVRQREALETSLKSIENQIAGLREKLNYLQNEKSNVPTDATGGGASDRSPVITETKANLLKLQLEEQRLLANFSESNRQVVNVRKQIELVKKFLAEQEAAIGQGGLRGEMETTIVDTLAELRFQEAKSASIRQQLGSLNSQVVQVPQMQNRYRDLMRERDAMEKNYETYSKKLEEARVSAEMDAQKIANISVIQAPVAPISPVYPKRSLNLALGFFVGALLGMVAAFVVDMTTIGAARERHPPHSGEGGAPSVAAGGGPGEV